MSNVIFVFMRKEAKGFHTFLCERRPDSDLVFPGQTVFPGGKIEHIDCHATAAFIREIDEELDHVVPLKWQRWETPCIYHVPIEHGAKVCYMVNREVPMWDAHKCFCYVVTEWGGTVPTHVSDDHAPYPLVWLPLDAPEIEGGCDNEIKIMLNRYHCQWNGFTRSDGSWEERNDELGIVVHGTKGNATERTSARLSAG